MIAYRAETSLYNSLLPNFKNTRKEGRALLLEIFTSNADLVPGYQNNTLTVIIYSLSTPRFNRALQSLCDIMNQTKTIYPKTNLRLIYKSIAF